MKKLFPRILTATTALVVSSTFTQAAFQPNIVSADAKWVMHADFEALRNSALGKEIIDAATKEQAEKADMPVRLDVAKVLTTIGSVTAYGTNFSKKHSEVDGTLVIEGTADLRKIAEAYVAQVLVSKPDAMTEVKDLPFEAYSIGGKETVLIAFPKEPIILVSKSREQLLKAHAVYLGNAPSMKGSKSSVASLLKLESQPFIRAASVVPTAELFPEGAPQARILTMTESAAIAIGESDKTAFAHVELVASSDDMADKLLKIVQGLAAMASLAETNDKALTDFLQSVAVKRQNRNVSVDLAYPSERLIQMVKTLHEERRNKSAPPPAPVPQGKLIAEWTAEQDLAGDQPQPDNLVYHTIENVALKQGSTIIIQGRRDQGEHARLDVVEIIPTGGNTTLKFEAEGMNLKGYDRQPAAFASGGKIVMAHNNSGTASFQFPAGDGSYTIKVRYVDETDGHSKFSMRLVDPETPKS